MNKTIEYDRVGFPMVWVNCLKGYVHLLPVTKIQFEYFLWDTPASTLDQTWLDRIYKLNERITPKKINNRNYWRAFMSGIAPAEAEKFAAWSGGSDENVQYSLPSDVEWRDAYNEMLLSPSIPPDEFEDNPGRISPRVLLLLRRLYDEVKHETLADQMLFDGGVLEWVQATNSTNGCDYAAHGQTSRSWSYSGNYLIRPFPVRSVPKGPDDNSDRAAIHGFRLLRRSLK